MRYFIPLIGISLFLVFIQHRTGYSQNQDSTMKIQMSILQTDDQTDNATIEEMAATIDELIQHPIELNNADLDDLQKLTMLSDFQIKSLWLYLEKHRPVLSIYELRAVMGFDTKDFETIKRFVSCNQVGKSKKTFLQNRVIVQEQYGEATIADSIVTNPKYLGKPTKTVMKWKSDIGRYLQVSAIAEKDAGEHFGKQGFDFYSANVSVVKYKYIKRLVIGDFSLHFGQGLVAWNGYTFRNLTDIRKRGDGLIPYKSVDENHFFRGAGVTMGGKHVDCTLFASSHKIDGIIDSATNTVTSLPNSGYHRSLTELRSKHTVLLSSVGANGTFRFNAGSIGITHITHIFNKSITPIDKAYNAFAFSGSLMSLTGVNAFIHLRHSDLFGEAAVNELIKPAVVCGGEFQLTSYLQFSLLVRDYSEGYYSFLNSGFSNGGKTSNEQGLYWAIRASIDSSNTILTSVDLYKHPWLQYGLYSESTGSVTSISYEHTLPDNGKLLLQYKYYNKPKNDTANGSPLKGITQCQENRFKAAIYTQIGHWRFITQGVFIFADLTTSPSLFLSQDIDFYYNDRFSTGIRYMVFDASGSSGISVYEPDVRVGTAALVVGEGDKFYIKTSYRFAKRMQLSAKYAYLNKLSAKIYSSKQEYALLLKWEF